MHKWGASTSDTTAPAPLLLRENSPHQPPAPRSNGWYESIQSGGLALQKHSPVRSILEAREASKANSPRAGNTCRMSILALFFAPAKTRWVLGRAKVRSPPER